MIEHVYRRAASTTGIDAAVVATDDVRIAQIVEGFGGIVRMTRSVHRTGTDRIAEVAAGLECELIVNVQGDLPLIESDMIRQVLQPFDSDASVLMATLRRPITDASEYANPNVVKVVVDRHDDALYFSRAPVPHVRGGDFPFARAAAGRGTAAPCPYKHVGLYAYRRAFLIELASLPPTPLEVAESLEQLRVLEHGFRIRTVETHYESIEVDTPEDAERVRQHLAVGTAVRRP